MQDPSVMSLTVSRHSDICEGSHQVTRIAATRGEVILSGTQHVMV